MTRATQLADFARGLPVAFAPRSELVAWVAANPAPPVGTVVTAGGLQYEYAGAGELPGLPGWVPLGDAFLDHFQENVTPGTTNVASGRDAMIAYMNANRVNGHLLASNYLMTAGAPPIVAFGVGIYGKGKGNLVNLFPDAPAPTTVTLTGTGHGFHLQNQDQKLIGFRLTSDTARTELSFDIQQPGVRVEPLDTSAAMRADRCRVDLRIDQQPGDGVLAIGPVTYFDPSFTESHWNKGFGFRGDAGTHPDLTRTYPHYPGLWTMDYCRAGFNGGHAVALSHPNVTAQANMAIRCVITNFDGYGNGMNTAIMYPSEDGIFYEHWIFGENCVMKDSAPCGRSGLSLTDEVLGGIWIAGRDNKLINNRYVGTLQPIYWGHVDVQPSRGLEINGVRLVNSSLTHANLVAVQSGESVGLRVYFDSYEHITAPYPPRPGGVTLDASARYRGRSLHHKSTHSTNATLISIADDAAYQIVLPTVSVSASATGVLTLASSAVAAGGGIFHVRAGTASPATTKWAGEANTVAGPGSGGGALTGTTGTDGNVSVSCDATSIYIENRRGFPITLSYSLTAFSPNTLGVEQV